MKAPRTEWLLARRAGIGGSDIAAILGLSPWRSPLDVYEDKTSEAPPVDEESEAMRWGTILEAVVADEWASRTGCRVQRVNSQLRHPEVEFAIGNIDRAIVPSGTRARLDKAGRLLGAEALLEVKTAGGHAAPSWGSDDDPTIPAHYAAQGMWYLAITGLPRIEFACLIGGQRLITRTLHRDDEAVAAMLYAARTFWIEHVQARVPPAPRSLAEVARLFRKDRGHAVEADATLLARIGQLRKLRDDEALISAHADGIELEVKAAMGEATAITVDGRPVVTWKASKDRSETDWRAVAEAVWQEPRRFETWHDHVQAHTTTTPGSRRFTLKEIKQ